MMRAMRALALVVAFVVEVAALVGLSVVGDHVGGIALAIALPLAGAVLWGLFAAPKRRYHLPWAEVLTKLLVFGGAAVGLIATGHVAAGVALAVVVILDHIALALLGED
jgi:uncharacterized protein DUF2568